MAVYIPPPTVQVNVCKSYRVSRIGALTFLFKSHYVDPNFFLMSSVHRWLYAFLLCFYTGVTRENPKAKGSGYIFHGMSGTDKEFVKNMSRFIGVG